MSLKFNIVLREGKSFFSGFNYNIQKSFFQGIGNFFYFSFVVRKGNYQISLIAAFKIFLNFIYSN
ncbi:hypothetical protein C4559_06145 [Candidatus Microgenomates bacterium]|nr:MAG: hypothetical protein C4559_06145 [Candidatus Microgenomates bacterium]